MYELGYNRLFWGMIFIIFNINIGFINILPNFVGYLLIYSGLKILSTQHEIFNKGKPLAVILTLLILKDILNFQNNNFLNGEFQINIWLLLISSVTMIINIYLMYIICKGIYLLSQERGIDELSKVTKTRWKFYLVFSVISLFYLPLSLNLPNYSNLLFIIISFLKLIALIAIAFLFRRCKHQLAE